MKLLLLLAARGGAGDELTATVVAEAVRLREHGATSVCAMRQIPDDPFGSAVPRMRPFEASIDARFDTSAKSEDESFEGLLALVGDLVAGAGPVAADRRPRPATDRKQTAAPA